MSIFGKLIGAVIDTAMVPVEVAKDIATLGGVLTDQDEPYTKQRLEKVQDKINSAADEAAD